MKQTQTSYECVLCKYKCDQKSHINLHIKGDKHNKIKEEYRIKLEKLSEDKFNKIKEKYKVNNISEILEKMEMKQHVKEKIKASPVFEKKKITGDIIWSITDNKDNNKEYDTIRNRLMSLVSRGHDLLRSNGSIVGVKAQNDIMNVLCLKMLQLNLNKNNFADLKKELSEDKYHKYTDYCGNIAKIIENEDIIKEWRNFVSNFLTKAFPNIYFNEDKTFNCQKANAITQLFKIFDEGININCEEELDAFSTTCGDIHEAFRKYGGTGKVAKELGQFFTPRNMIHLIFHGLNIKKMLKDNITIYDPCMGTGGFLARLFKLGNIKSENIYGCETEADTIKFGKISLLLTTKDNNNNIEKCDSLCENKFINKKFDVIITNPPFGTKMKYDQLKDNFESFKAKQDTLENIKFTDIYPLKTNNGACLFVQHCVYTLADKGICAIVLPDGELFEGNSNWSKNFRKWLAEKVNIQTILKVPSGAFEHAGVKTNVVVFTKDGPTQNIHFMETSKECNVVKDMFIISAKELKNAGYSLDVGEYLVEEKDNYNVPMVALGEVITKQNNFQDINADIDYKIVKMSKLVAPEIREIKKGCNIKSTKLQLVEENTFIMSKILNYCYGIYNNNIQNGYLSSEYWIFKIRDNTLFNYFMLIYKNIIVHKLKSIAHGVGVPRINYQDFMSKIKIPLPSLEVQQQIVDELSQIETSIETIESRIAQLKREKDQYKKYGRKAEIRELLKDSEKKMLGEVCDIINGSRIVKKNNTEGIYPVFGSGNQSFTTNTYNREGNTTIIGRFALSEKCVRIIKDTKLFLNDSGISINCECPVKHNYISYYLLFNQNIIYNLSRGQAQKNLNMVKFKELKIPLPSQEIQQQCITLFEEKEKFIQSIDNKIDSEKAYIEELKQLAKDIISNYC